MNKHLLTKYKPRILVFLHGTSIMHKNALGLSREEIVQQVKDNLDDSIPDFASYIPIGNVVEKLTKWQGQGAEILYLSSHTTPKNLKKDVIVLEHYEFPKGPIFYRKSKTWSSVVQEANPDILIEDDCESIGGDIKMTYPNLKIELRSKINSIVLKEFGGIDHLPDNIDELKHLSSISY